MTWTLQVAGRRAIPIRAEGGEVTTELPGRDATARVPIRIGLKTGDDIAPHDARTLQASRAQLVDEQGAFFDGIVDDSELDEGILVLRGHYSADAKGGPDGRGRREVLTYRLRDLGAFGRDPALETAANLFRHTRRFNDVTGGLETADDAFDAGDLADLIAIAPPGSSGWTWLYGVYDINVTADFAGEVLSPGSTVFTQTNSGGTVNNPSASFSLGGIASVRFRLRAVNTTAASGTRKFFKWTNVDLRGTSLTGSTLASSAVLAHAIPALCPLWSTDLTGITTTADDVYELALDLTDLDGVVGAVNGAWGYDFYIDGTGADGLPRPRWEPFAFTTANTWTARRKDGAEISTGGPSLEGLATDCWVTYTDPATGLAQRLRRTATSPPITGRRVDITLDAGTVSTAVAQALGDAALNAASVQGATGQARVAYGALRDPARRVTPGWRLRAPAALRVEDAVAVDVAASADVRDATTTFKVIGTTAYQDGTVDVRLDNDLSLLDVLVRRVQTAVGIVKA